MGDKQKKERRVPKLRFPGFTGDWEQRKLGDILEERHNKTADFLENPLYSLTIENGVTPKTERYERDFLVKKEESIFKVVKPLEFVTNPMNLRFGAVGYNTNPFNVSVSGYYDVFSIDNNQCSSFWNSYFKTPTVMKILDNAATGSLIEKRRVKYSTLKTLELPMPALLEEKRKIAGYFEKLDTLINLHQRKCDETKALKKYMLQKMFPQSGMNTPELRFNSFIDGWKQCKLGVVVNVCSGKDYKHLDEGDIPVYGTGGYMLSVTEALSDEKDAIGIGRKGTIDKPYILKAPFWTVDTLFYCIPYESYDLNFVFALFQNINWKAMDESTGVPSLSKSAINNVVVLVPSYDEQRIIGAYFSSFDYLITLHQRKLTHLEELKKGLLQQMFV